MEIKNFPGVKLPDTRFKRDQGVGVSNIGDGKNGKREGQETGDSSPEFSDSVYTTVGQ